MFGNTHLANMITPAFAVFLFACSGSSPATDNLAEATLMPTDVATQGAPVEADEPDGRGGPDVDSPDGWAPQTSTTACFNAAGVGLGLGWEVWNQTEFCGNAEGAEVALQASVTAIDWAIQCFNSGDTTQCDTASAHASQSSQLWLQLAFNGCPKALVPAVAERFASHTCDLVDGQVIDPRWP